MGARVYQPGKFGLKRVPRDPFRPKLCTVLFMHGTLSQYQVPLGFWGDHLGSVRDIGAHEPHTWRQALNGVYLRNVVHEWDERATKGPPISHSKSYLMADFWPFCAIFTLFGAFSLAL